MQQYSDHGKNTFKKTRVAGSLFKYYNYDD